MDRLKEVPFAITICDREGKILEMNDRSKETFAKYGDLIGHSLFDCHHGASEEKLRGLLENHNVNAYTISKTASASSSTRPRGTKTASSAATSNSHSSSPTRCPTTSAADPRTAYRSCRHALQAWRHFLYPPSTIFTLPRAQFPASPPSPSTPSSLLIKVKNTYSRRSVSEDSPKPLRNPSPSPRLISATLQPVCTPLSVTLPVKRQKETPHSCRDTHIFITLRHTA